MRTLDARQAEEAVEAVVGAEGDEAIRFSPVTAFQHLHDGGLQVVVADHAVGDPTEMLEGPHVPVEEGLLRLAQVDAVEALAGRRQPHDEHPPDDENSAQVKAHPPEVDLGLLADRVMLGNCHFLERHPALGADGADVAPHRGLGDIGAALLDEALIDAVGGVALLLRCLLILLEPGVDRRLPRPERRRDSRRWWLARRRRRGIECLAHRSSVHAEPLGERADRKCFPIVSLPDLLEQLHSDRTPSAAFLRRLREASKVGQCSDGVGRFEDIAVGPDQTIVPTRRCCCAALFGDHRHRRRGSCTATSNVRRRQVPNPI